MMVPPWWLTLAHIHNAAGLTDSVSLGLQYGGTPWGLTVAHRHNAAGLTSLLLLVLMFGGVPWRLTLTHRPNTAGLTGSVLLVLQYGGAPWWLTLVESVGRWSHGAGTLFPGEHYKAPRLKMCLNVENRYRISVRPV